MTDVVVEGVGDDEVMAVALIDKYELSVRKGEAVATLL